MSMSDPLLVTFAPATQLDDLTLNAHEKDYMALNLMDIMSNQFIGCPLSRPIVPRNPSLGDRELLLALDLVSAPVHTAHDSVSPEAHMFAHDALHRSQILLDLQNRTTTCRSHLQHLLSPESLTSGVYLDLSFDEIYDNTIDRPAVDFLHLDHRLGELLRFDVFTSTPSAPPPHSLPASSSGAYTICCGRAINLHHLP